MKCPSCHRSDTHVLETREVGPNIRRRRECDTCRFRLTTVEVQVGVKLSAVFRVVVAGDGLSMQLAEENC